MKVHFVFFRSIYSHNSLYYFFMLKKIPRKNTSFLTIFSFGRRVLAPGKFRATGHISISYQPKPSKQKFNSSQDLWLSIGTRNYFFGRLKAEIFEYLSRGVGISVGSSAKSIGISVGVMKVSYFPRALF